MGVNNMKLNADHKYQPINFLVGKLFPKKCPKFLVFLAICFISHTHIDRFREIFFNSTGIFLYPKNSFPNKIKKKSFLL
jgi:hypothetical protein